MNLSIFSFEAWRQVRAFPRRSRSTLLGIFLLIPAAIALGQWILVTVFFQTNYQMMATAALGADTASLALGSSRVFYGIDPRRFGPPGHHVNLAANYMDHRGDLRVLGLHLPALGGLSRVFMEFGMASVRYDGAAIAPHALVPLGDSWMPRPVDFFRNPDRALRQLLTPVFRWRLTPRFFETRRSITGNADEPMAEVPGFIPSRMKVSHPDFLAERRIRLTRTHLQGFAEGTRGANLAAAASMVRLLHRRGVRLVLVRFPKEPHLRRIYPPDWHQMVQGDLADLKAAVGGIAVEFWDFSNDGRFTEEHFRDPDHLNATGAAILTDLLRQIP